MRRYFFDVDHDSHIHDNDGDVLPGKVSVEQRAAAILYRLTCEKRPNAFSPPITVTVRDEAGTPVYRATMRVQSSWHAKG